MQLQDMYQEIILDHYRNPHHKGLRDPYDAEVYHINPTCGDEVKLRVSLKGVDGASAGEGGAGEDSAGEYSAADAIVEDVSYESLGCSISQASTSVMTDLVVGKQIGRAHV